MDKPSSWIFAAVLYAAASWFMGVMDVDGMSRVLMAGAIAATPLLAWMGGGQKEGNGE